MTPVQQALLDATQKELAWRLAFNAAADKVLAGTAGKGFMKASRDAQDEYLKACVVLHQLLKGWAIDGETDGTAAVQDRGVSDDQNKQS